MEEMILRFFENQGPWAFLFVALFIWVLRENLRRETRLIDVIDRLSNKYDEMSVDLHEIKESLHGRRMG